MRTKELFHTDSIFPVFFCLVVSRCGGGGQNRHRAHAINKLQRAIITVQFSPVARLKKMSCCGSLHVMCTMQVPATAPGQKVAAAAHPTLLRHPHTTHTTWAERLPCWRGQGHCFLSAGQDANRTQIFCGIYYRHLIISHMKGFTACLPANDSA